MKPSSALAVFWVAGLIATVLGILVWTGNARQLVVWHEIAGLIMVVALWMLGAGAARAGVARWIVWGAMVWGLVLPVLGEAQNRLLIGNEHWLIEVVHLAVGVVTLVLGQALWTGSHGARPARLVSPSP